jgi:hypothetical protein
VHECRQFGILKNNDLLAGGERALQIIAEELSKSIQHLLRTPRVQFAGTLVPLWSQILPMRDLDHISFEAP